MPPAPAGWGDLCAAAPAPLATQGEAVRRAVARVFAGATQRCVTGWRAVTFHDEAVGFVCGVFLRPRTVSVYFASGAQLADPDRLFTRRQRLTAAYDVAPGRRIRVRALAAMIARAVAHGAVRRYPKRHRNRD